MARPRPFLPLSAVAALDPSARDLTATQVAGLKVVRMDRGATTVRSTGFGAGASRPAVDDSGRYAFIRLEGGEIDAGSLWVASALQAGGEAIALPREETRSAVFAPEPGSMVIGAEPEGVWLLGLEDGRAQQLTADGWLPEWLP